MTYAVNSSYIPYPDGLLGNSRHCIYLNRKVVNDERTKGM
jgi:hypothetical protein